MLDLLLNRVLFSELPGSMVGVGVMLVTREEVEVLLTLTELLGVRVVDVDSTSLPFVGLGEVLRVRLASSIDVVVLGASSLLAGANRTAAAIFTHKQRQSKALVLEAVGSNMTSGLPICGGKPYNSRYGFASGSGLGAWGEGWLSHRPKALSDEISTLNAPYSPRLVLYGRKPGPFRKKEKKEFQFKQESRNPDRCESLQARKNV